MYDSDVEALPLTDGADATSVPFIGQWRRLVSTTNWEKGRIIHQWRQALIASGAAATEYSDEAWSRRVGNVSGQHVGRLRRVYERFADVQPTYPGLYWSHFQAALDWDEAEMWLEGALQSGWSVADMRRQRWQAQGAVERLRPRDDEIVEAEWDEDGDPQPQGATADPTLTDSTAAAKRPREPLDAPSAGLDEADYLPADAEDDPSNLENPPRLPVRPFAELPALPADLADAFEQFKLAILNHKLGGWQQVGRDDVLAALDALKELATAPAE
jgi:hypothetical protein